MHPNNKKDYSTNIINPFSWFSKKISRLVGLISKITYKNVVNKIEYKKMLNHNEIKDRFIIIYNKNLWSSKESKSGEGSEVKQTKNLSLWLKKNLKKFKINTFVDAPCGDLNWIKKILNKLDINYVGIDIVPQIIKKNKKNFSSKKIKFEVKNICSDKLPKCDLLMVRDCLFHLSYKDINKFLKNLSRTQYKYLLTTTHIETNIINHDIVTGDFRTFDLFASPFNFKKKDVIEKINDFSPEYKYNRKIMILIKKKNVPVSIKFK
ncbi:methyltransferase domain-containing protein [Candidatus Pelagibacter sp.]|nr:methyltransferase domain-containing protein [Candidatus Pelagibacter sp.]